ncbi:uncharacterized protein LOC135372181 isoform X5 [Ornithodoros turicata]|uniref:uncharacterized protein LOC135372181 isoform X5 n=1 Tax=Ornithodoros turicata TaxID=34597 RepID=UPI00313968EC
MNMKKVLKFDFLFQLQSRLPRYLTHLYRSQPLNIIGVRHLNITGVHRHHTVCIIEMQVRFQIITITAFSGQCCAPTVRNERFN